MALKCEVYMQTSQATLSVRMKTPASNLQRALKRIYGDIIRYLNENEDQPAGPPYIAYYDRNGDDWDIEAGFPVFKAFPGKPPIQPSHLPAGKVVSCLYTGPYDLMERAYNEMNRWLDDNGYETTGIAYEIFMNDPAFTPPNALKTQILFLLKGKPDARLE